MSAVEDAATNWKVASGGIALGLALAFLPLLFPVVLVFLAYFRPHPLAFYLLLPSLGLLVVAMIVARAFRKWSFLKGLLIAGTFAALLATTLLFVNAQADHMMKFTP